MTRIQTLGIVAAAVACAAAAIYLHDPPWVGGVTTGFRLWQTDGRGDRFRWTTGRASFFVPSDTTAMTLRFRPLAPLSDKPITVDVSVDDRQLATIELPDRLHPDPNLWVRTTLPLPWRPTSRRFRRVDLRVHRWREEFHQGVQFGEVELERPARQPLAVR